MNLLLIMILFVIAIVVFIVVQGNRKKKLMKGLLRQREAANLVRQEIILKELSTIGDLITDNSLSASAIITKVDASLKILDANNIDGNFTDVIDEIRHYVSDELEKKDVPKHELNKLFLNPSPVAQPAKTVSNVEVDPLAEAEVYLAYGRKKQALEILELALRDNPARKDIEAKLIELKGTNPYIHM